MPFTTEELSQMILRQGEYWRMAEICEEAIQVEDSTVKVFPCTVTRCEGIGGRIVIDAIRQENDPFLTVRCAERSIDARFFRWRPLTRRQWVVVDPTLVRQPEAVRLIGDPSRAKRELGWAPQVSFEQLMAMMVDADVDRLRATNAPRASAGR